MKVDLDRSHKGLKYGHVTWDGKQRCAGVKKEVYLLRGVVSESMNSSVGLLFVFAFYF